MTKDQKTLRDSLMGYLSDVDRLTKSSKMRSLESYYMRHGKNFYPVPLMPEDQTLLLKIFDHSHHLFRMGQCYMNAAHLSQENPKLTYCEGFALSSNLPMAFSHAWVEFRGRAIDITWRKGKTDRPTENATALIKRVTHNIQSVSYFGIKVAPRLLCKYLLERRLYAPVAETDILRGRGLPA